MKKKYKYILLPFVFFLSMTLRGQSYAEKNYIDSLNNELKRPNLHDTTYIRLMYEIGVATPIFRVTYWDSVADFSTIALKKTKNKTVILSLKNTLAYALNNLGYIYQDLGQIEKTLEYHYKSLKMREEVGDKSGIAESLNNIGYVYKNQGQNEKALEYYQKSLKIREETGNKSGIAISFNNIGAVYDDLGQKEDALEYYHKSLKIQEEISDKSGIATSLNNIGAVYNDQGQSEKALLYYLKSLEIREEIVDKFGISNSLNNIGHVYDKLGQKEKAKEYASKALKLSQELGYPDLVKVSSNLLSQIAQKQGDYKVAFEMYQLYITMRDSINNEETYKASVQQSVNYEYEKQALEDSIINAEAEKVYLANLEAERAISAQQQTEIKAQKTQNIFLFIGLGLVGLFGFFMYNRYKVTQKQKGIIEEKEKETAFQKELIEIKQKETEHQKEIIEEKHKEITDSINYAERIQRSFLATKELLDENLNDYFVFFNPKDIVSGDFYWASILKNGNFAFCCADSTGHGVPGAIMSILNISSLEKAVENETEPHQILNKTRELIIERLKKDGSPEGGKDGMDCSLLVLNQDRTQVTFASANNPVFIVRAVTSSGSPEAVVSRSETHELLEFRPDKMPVGKHDKDQTPFTLNSVKLQKDDVIYALTDGFPDQFGGDKGKKYMIKNLKELFLSIAHLPMKEQEEKLLEEFSNWKGEHEQVDDVCIIGIKI